MAEIPDESMLLEQLMDHLKDNIYFKDRESRFVLINDEGAKKAGRNSPEELIGKTDFDIFTDEHGRDAYEDEQRILSTGVPLLGKEEKETWADGHETWVSTTKMPLYDSDGEILGTFGISRDITEHKRAELLAEKLAEQNRRLSEEMERDLLMASGLQKTFLPASYPVFPDGVAPIDSAARFCHHYHSTGAVGGDFCSVRKISDTEAGILLCDVMGHGVRAALVTALMRAVVEEISYKEKDPGCFLQHMNMVLKPIIQQGDLFLFASACYVVLDVSTGTLRYANAGHPVPILLNAKDDKAEWLVDDPTASGPALAIAPDIEYKTSVRILHPNDAIIMYTDGIYEVEDYDDEEFGTERLLTVANKHRKLMLSSMFPTLIGEICQYAAGHKFGDDVCLIGCRFAHTLDSNAK